MLTWAVISAAMMFVRTPTVFYILRFLLGVAEAGFFPGIILYLTYWYPAPRRAGIIALFMTAIPIAGVIGGTPFRAREVAEPALQRTDNRSRIKYQLHEGATGDLHPNARLFLLPTAVPSSAG